MNRRSYVLRFEDWDGSYCYMDDDTNVTCNPNKAAKFNTPAGALQAQRMVTVYYSDVVVRVPAGRKVIPDVLN